MEGPRLRWWQELLTIIAFYSVYSFIRNEGVATDSVRKAFANARSVIRVERLLGTYHEESIQDAFLGWDGFISFWNVFYGSAHFIVTTCALIWLFRKGATRYQLWRNTLAFTTALALIGYAFFPLMPPRLLPPRYGFVDTLATYGGLWSFDSRTMKAISNQYAAMPSLHFAWASWCVFVLHPGMKTRLARILLVVYPFLTLFAIIVTGNHFWLDALGGAVVLAVGYVFGAAVTARLADRADRRGLRESAAAGALQQ